jgi:hypothetical protein
MPSTFLKAADTQGIQISPTTYNYEIKPGESQSGKIILKNLNSNILNYVIEVEGFSKASDEGAPSFAIDSSAGCISSVSSWFFFKDEKGQIPAGQQREIPFTVSVPKDAEPGGHYAAIFAKEVKEAAKGKSQLGISSRVGTLILIAVPGDVKMGAEITEFKTPRFVWNGSISFAMKVKNTGTVHYDSVGSVKIKSLVSKESKFELATHTILPQNSRNYEKNWTKKYPFGYYKITPIATDGNKQEISASTVTVIAIPLVIVIPILVLLILIILTISYLRKHLRFVNGQNKVPPTNNPPSIQA